MTKEQQAAKEFRMPFGKHKGRALYDIAASGDALYLDWLVGQNLYPETKKILETFLAIDWVSRMIDSELAAKEKR